MTKLEWRQIGDEYRADYNYGDFAITPDKPRGTYDVFDGCRLIAQDLPSLKLSKRFCAKYATLYDWLDAEIEKGDAHGNV